MTSRKCEHDPAGYVRDEKGVEYCPECPTVPEALVAGQRHSSSAATTTPPSFLRGEKGNIILRWRCLTCGWSVDVQTPGFAGDGYSHFEGDPFSPCGPLVASRV